MRTPEQTPTPVHKPEAPFTGYSHIANIEGFNPFDPDPAHALREVLTFLYQPYGGYVCYQDGTDPNRSMRMTGYPSNKIPMLLAMLERAVKKADLAADVARAEAVIGRAAA